MIDLKPITVRKFCWKTKRFVRQNLYTETQMYQFARAQLVKLKDRLPSINGDVRQY